MTADPGPTPTPARSTVVETPLAALDTVTVRFPKRADPVLSRVSFTLRAGEQVLVLGASGSGKSTLLATLTGVIPHAVTADLAGEVTVAGTETAETTVTQRSRHVGVMSQDPGSGLCLPDVEQELALPLENRAVDPVEISGRIEEELRAVHATALRRRRTSALSGGEGQRIALAASTVTRPALLLLDEPTSMLDPAGVLAVRAALTDSMRGYQPTVVVVEHRLDDFAGPGGVAALPRRALVLDERGELIADGPTAELLRTHARALHAAGCWLPLEAELYALTGVGGGLASPPNRDLLRALSTRSRVADPAQDDTRADQAQRQVPALSAAGLTVMRQGTPTRRSRKPPEVAPVLADIDLDLYPGEIVAVVGANGVGKSTLLLALAGLLSPAAGAVTGARAGMVFQNPEHQFIAHTVADEIRHGIADEPGAVIAGHLHRHRLEHLAEQNPFRLSGGEKRRLSLAAMLAHRRPTLLLDEPTLGLDRGDTIATIHALRGAAAEGRSILFASHDLRLVATLADRIVVLADGGVIADHPVLDVLSDTPLLLRAGLRLPALLAWLQEHLPSRNAIRTVLDSLDDAVDGAAPASTGAATS